MCPSSYGIAASIAILVLLCNNQATAQSGCKADFVLAIDSSGSIKDTNRDGVDNYRLLLTFARSFAASFPVGFNHSLFSVVRFSGTAVRAWPLRQYPSHQTLLPRFTPRYIRHMNWKTNLAAVFRTIRNQVFNDRDDRKNVPNVVIFLTDGNATLEANQTIPEAKLTHDNDVMVLVVGIGDVNQRTIALMSSSPQQQGQSYFLVDDFQSLSAIKDLLVEKTCQRIRESLGQTAPPLPTPPPTNAAVCPVTADFVILLDSSGSIRDQNAEGWEQNLLLDNWLLQLRFASEFVQQFNIGEHNSRFVPVIFSDYAHALWNFNNKQYYDVTSIVTGIATAPYHKYTTNIAEALRITHQNVLLPSNGARAGIPKVVVIVTDGNATVAQDKTKQEALQLQQMAHVFVVGVTAKVAESELKMLSSSPQQKDMNYFISRDFAHLDLLMENITAQVCKRLQNYTGKLTSSSYITYTTTQSTKVTPKESTTIRLNITTTPKPLQTTGNIQLTSMHERQSTTSTASKNPTTFPTEYTKSSAPSTRAATHTKEAISTNGIATTSTTMPKEGPLTSTYAPIVPTLLESTMSQSSISHKETPPASDIPPDGAPPTSPTPPDGAPPISPTPPDGAPPTSPTPPDGAPPISPTPPDGAPPTSPTPPDGAPPTSPTPPDGAPLISQTPPDGAPATSPTPPEGAPPISPTPPEGAPPISPTPPDGAPPTSPPPPDGAPPTSPMPPDGAPPTSPIPPDGAPPTSPTPPEGAPPISPTPPDGAPPTSPPPPDGAPPTSPMPPDGAPPTSPIPPDGAPPTSPPPPDGAPPTSPMPPDGAPPTSPTPPEGAPPISPTPPNLAILTSSSAPPVLTTDAPQPIVQSTIAPTTLDSSAPDSTSQASSSTRNFPISSTSSDSYSTMDYATGTLAPLSPFCPNGQTLVADFALLVDSSGSIRDTNPPNTEPGSPTDNWQRMRRFLQSFTALFDVSNETSHFALVRFSTDATVDWPLGQHLSPASLRDALGALQYKGGWTNTAAALSVMSRDVFNSPSDRQNVPNVGVIITDGVPTINKESAVPMAALAKAQGTTLFAIGVTSSIDENLLREMSSPPREKNRNYFSAMDFSQLQNIARSVQESVCRFVMPGPANFTACPHGGQFMVDFAFVVDSSGSIRDKNQPNSSDNWQLVQDFLKNFVDYFSVSEDSVRFALVQFSNKGNLRWDLQTYSNKTELKFAIDDLPFGGGETNTSGALRVTRKEVYRPDRGDRKGVPNVAVVITDGIPTLETALTLQEAEKTRKDGVIIYVVGVTNAVDKEMLKMLSSGEQKENVNWFTTMSFSGLNSILEQLVESACRSVVTQTPAPIILPDCQGTADIAFVLDSSDSTFLDAATDWPVLLSFVAKIVQRFDTDSGKVRIAALKYSRQTTVEFNLQQFSRNEDIRNRISRIAYNRGTSNTSGALRTLREQVFNLQRGDRQNVPNIAIVITDGQSNVDTNLLPSEARQLREAGASVLAVGITRQVDSNELRTIAGSTLNVLQIASYNNLDDSVVETIANLVCPPACLLDTDIALVLDSSSSIVFNDLADWQRVKDFAKSIVSSFRIGPSDSRIAVVTFSSRASVSFYLNRYQTQNQVLAAIESLRNAGADTNIAEALDITRTDVFTAARGDRPNARNIVVLITDGFHNVGLGNHTVIVREAARRLRETGVEIFTVGVGFTPLEDELRAIADDQFGNRYFPAVNFRDLQNKVPRLVNSSCVRRVITTPRPTTTTTTTTLSPPPDCPGAADVAIVLDESGSISERNFKRMKTFAANIAQDLAIDGGTIRLAVMTFATFERVQFNLNQYSRRSDVIAAINRIRYNRGATFTASAIRFLRTTVFTSQNGDRPQAQNVAVIITDGESNSTQVTLAEAKAARRSGIHILSVGVGGWTNQYELDGIASYPYSRNRLSVSQFEALDTLRQTIRQAICNTNDDCLSNPCRNGGTCNNGIRHYRCRCRLGYSGINCQNRCNNAADIVFALDASGSIGEDDFRRLVDFATSVVLNLDVDNPDNEGRRGTKVGLITFSTNTKVEFHLNAYNNKKDVLDNIFPVYTSGSTNMAEVLRYVRTSMFTAANGDRPEAPNYMVLITDGKSDNRSETLRMSIEARKRGIHIFAIGIGPQVRRSELRFLASPPLEANMLSVNEFSQLNSLVSSLSTGICNNQNECSSRPCRNGGTCVDGVFGFTCRCNDQYTGRLCDRQCSGVADVAIMLDTSGSIRSERFPMSIIDEIEVAMDKTRIAIGYWADSAGVQFNLRDYWTRKDVTDAMFEIRFRAGRTNTASGIRLMRTDIFNRVRGDRQTVQNYGIIITDGNSNINQLNTIPEAIAARVAGIHLIVVSVGDSLGRVELRGIASEPKDRNMFNVNSIRSITNLRRPLINALCNRFEACDSRPCRNGGRCRPAPKTYFCVCSGNFAGRNCEQRCGKQLDLTLIMDISGSTQDKYEQVIDVSGRIIQGINMGQIQTRIAAIPYASDVKNIEMFDLNRYTDKISVLNALNFNLLGRETKTNTYEGLRVAADRVYSIGGGDRPGVDNVAVLITDGKSNLRVPDTVPMATRLKRDRNVELYVIALGSSPNMADINNMASSPESVHVLRLRNTTMDTQNVAETLLQRICN